MSEEPLVDPFHRTITYLRVSVTDKCNYRCDYCMPEQGVHIEGKHSEYLSYEEITRVVHAFADLGVNKVRLTGGEPLVRKNLHELVRQLSAHRGLTDMALSTNAHHLAREAKRLKDAGLKRINVSIDSVDADNFARITRGGDLSQVTQGIQAAVDADLAPIRLNMVVMKGINDHEMGSMLDYAMNVGAQLRFIEVMPIGAAGIHMMDRHVSADVIKKRLSVHLGAPLLAVENDSIGGGPAQYFRSANLPDDQADIGIIHAVSQHFCAGCNRVRLTAKGVLALCLGQEDAVNLREPLRDGISDAELKQLIRQAIAQKPERHFFKEQVHNIEFRQMVALGG